MGQLWKLMEIGRQLVDDQWTLVEIIAKRKTFGKFRKFRIFGKSVKLRIF